VTVVYGGIDHSQFRPLEMMAAERDEVRRRYGLPERFLLYVGKIQPRKNLVRVIEALHRVRSEHGELHLVIAGAGGWMNRDIEATIARLGLSRHVHFTGWIHDDLTALYNLADMVVFPSLYEGFGFPVLEAMACGTPVVTSRTSSLAEVAGEAALLVDPASVEAIAEAIGRLLADVELRDHLATAGLARAAEFTWTRCAAETRACYLAVAAGRPVNPQPKPD
jgi:glycosyltransferase involved in cell wall biosynthesis